MVKHHPGQSSYSSLFNSPIPLLAIPPLRLARTRDLVDAWLKALKNYHNNLQQGKNDIPDNLKALETLSNATYSRFIKPITRTENIPAQYKEIYQIDAFRFSAYKMHRISRELRYLAYDSKGNILPFDQFKRKALKVYNIYNSQYLRAEIVQAQNATASADNWHSFSDNENLFLLQYRTAHDERVRASHRVLDGITLPKSHPFWQTHYPPNGWGCRCHVVQVLRKKYEKDYQ